ncbi:antiterminator [Escherichia coli]|nr:antiterminator [Escherichia coli]
MTATADYSGKTKGQLQAFAEGVQVNTTRLKRQRRTELDGNGKRVTVPSSPVPGVETRDRKTPQPLIEPVEYATASWRRALTTMDSPLGPWLLWCYCGDLAFDKQMAITKWAWAEFKAWLGSRKVQKKTLERLKSLMWLAAQDVKAEVNGREIYSVVRLCELVEANPKSWAQTFAPHWAAMRGICLRLDREALHGVNRKRINIKAVNFHA